MELGARLMSVFFRLTPFAEETTHSASCTGGVFSACFRSLCLTAYAAGSNLHSSTTL
mgnify:FL=1